MAKKKPLKKIDYEIMTNAQLMKMLVPDIEERVAKVKRDNPKFFTILRRRVLTTDAFPFQAW